MKDTYILIQVILNENQIFVFDDRLCYLIVLGSRTSLNTKAGSG